MSLLTVIPLGVGDAFQRTEEAILRVHADHVDVHVLGEGFHDLVALAMP